MENRGEVKDMVVFDNVTVCTTYTIRRTESSLIEARMYSYILTQY